VGGGQRACAARGPEVKRQCRVIAERPLAPTTLLTAILLPPILAMSETLSRDRCACLVGRRKSPSGMSWYGGCSYAVVSERFSLGRRGHDKPSLTRSGSGSSAHSGR